MREKKYTKLKRNVFPGKSAIYQGVHLHQRPYLIFFLICFYKIQVYVVFCCILHISKNVYIPWNVFLNLSIWTVLNKCAIAHLIDFSACDIMCDILAHLTCFQLKGQSPSIIRLIFQFCLSSPLNVLLPKTFNLLSFPICYA